MAGNHVSHVFGFKLLEFFLAAPGWVLRARQPALHLAGSEIEFLPDPFILEGQMDCSLLVKPQVKKGAFTICCCVWILAQDVKFVFQGLRNGGDLVQLFPGNRAHGNVNILGFRRTAGAKVP